MRLLLDTHILIWALSDPSRLSPAARDLLEDTGNDIFFSAASIWEIAIKARLGRLTFNHRPGHVTRTALATGFEELPIRSDAAEKVEELPLLHRDPFDRLLVAQALCGPLRLVTADTQIVPYTDLVMLVS